MGKIAIIIAATLLVFLLFLGFAWYRTSLPPAEFETYKGLSGLSSNDVLTVKMERMAEQAAMDAWTRARMRVRIGIHSLSEFERYLGRLSQSPWFTSLSPKDKQAEAYIAGAFVGEAIRRSHGGTWMETSDLPNAGAYPLKVGETTIYPINWCLKRLVNGPEDNVYHKYVFAILERTNEISGQVIHWTNTGTELKPVPTNTTLK